MHIVAVVPAYNEVQTIGRVIRDLQPHVDAVVVVDDCSTDATASAVRAAGVTLVKHIINRGQGAALRTGMAYAMQQGADVIVHFDADGQHNPEQIKDLVAPLLAGSADIALGSRFLGRAESIPLTRKLLLRVATIFSRVTTGLELTDTNNGFRALTRKAVREMELTQDRMAHASEILGQVAQKKLHYVEVPVTITYTTYSVAKGQSGWGAVRILRDLAFRKVMK